MQNCAPLYLHELLQCANDYINMSVVPTLCPAVQTKKSSTQLYKDHPTNGAQRKETGMKTKQSLCLWKSLIPFFSVFICITEILQQIWVLGPQSISSMRSAPTSSQPDIQRSTYQRTSCLGSQDNLVIKDLRRSLVQPSAQSRDNCEIRPSCLGLLPACLEMTMVGAAQHLWTACFNALLSLQRKKFFLKWSLNLSFISHFPNAHQISAVIQQT